ncbi:MAG: hypothetical protein MUD12_16255 [Spirochaetes bacterium]|jgi:hypothetical protein|nr:hypothetical protein [Spirochaetota bacterium]
MPLYLEPMDIDDKFKNCGSVLFVSCDVCPKMCMSVKKNVPYMEPFRFGNRKDFFVEYIGGLRKSLERRGIKTGIFRKPALKAMMCLWPGSLRDKLSKKSTGYDAVAVIGCDSAVFTVRDSITDPAVEIVQLMSVEGVANFKSVIGFPFTMKLEIPNSGSLVKISSD